MALADDLGKVAGELQQMVAELDADVLTGDDAERLAQAFGMIERVAAAGQALTAARAAACGAWRKAGHRSPAEWLGHLAGQGRGQAQRSLETAERVGRQPEVAGAWRAGTLSNVQAEEISIAAAAAPQEAAALVEVAAHESIRGLRDACRKVRSAAASAEEECARYRRIHAGRYLRTWTDSDGAGRLAARLTPDAYASVCAALSPFESLAIDDARNATAREPYEALAADALVAMAQAAAGHSGDGASAAPGDGQARPATVIVRVDHDAFVRGHVRPGETCEVDGAGPVPVATARAIADDAFLAVVVADDTDVRSVVHLGRHPTAAQRTALLVRDPVCVVDGCGVSRGLEIDHTDPWALTHVTCIDRLARLCRHHHHLKTYEGWTLTGRPGSWRFDPPDTGITPDQRARQPRPRDAPRPGSDAPAPSRSDWTFDSGPDPFPLLE